METVIVCKWPHPNSCVLTNIKSTMVHLSKAQLKDMVPASWTQPHVKQKCYWRSTNVLNDWEVQPIWSLQLKQRSHGTTWKKSKSIWKVTLSSTINTLNPHKGCICFLPKKNREYLETYYLTTNVVNRESNNFFKEKSFKHFSFGLRTNPHYLSWEELVKLLHWYNTCSLPTCHWVTQWQIEWKWLLSSVDAILLSEGWRAPQN